MTATMMMMVNTPAFEITVRPLLLHSHMLYYTHCDTRFYSPLFTAIYRSFV